MGNTGRRIEIEILVAVILIGILVVLGQVAWNLSRLVTLTSISLHLKPARDQLPLGWAVLELGDQLLVTVEGRQSLQQVVEIHDNGCITLQVPVRSVSP